MDMFKSVCDFVHNYNDIHTTANTTIGTGSINANTAIGTMDKLVAEKVQDQLIGPKVYYNEPRLYLDATQMSVRYCSIPRIDHVLCSGPATVTFFKDGTKRVVKIADNLHPSFDDDRELAVYYCVLKRVMGNSWRKELAAFSKDITEYSLGEYMYTYIEKAFIASMIRRIEPDYIEKVQDIMRKPMYIYTNGKSMCIYGKDLD